MASDGNSESRDPAAGRSDPRTFAAIEAELMRILGSMSSESEPDGVNWAMPMKSLDQILQLLQNMPSDIGVAGLTSRLQAHRAGAPGSDDLPPERPSNDGA
jgi:hypothetical protein